MTHTTEELRDILAQPGALVGHLNAAHHAHEVWCNNPHNPLRNHFEAVWHSSAAECRAAIPGRDASGRVDPADAERCHLIQLRNALELAEIYSALRNLTHEQRVALETTPQGPDRQRLIDEALAAIPAGAAWLNRKAATDAEREKAAALAAAQRQAEHEAAQPAAILAEIEATGVTLALDKPGKAITASGGEIAPGLIDRLRDYKAGVIAILAARREAEAPKVLAL